MDQDQVLYDASPSMFRNHPILFVLSVVLILAAGLGLVILLFWYIDSRSTRLRITATDIQLERGLFSKYRTDVDIRMIRSVRAHQTLLQRMFDTGTLEFFTAGDDPEIVVKGMPEPNTVRDLVRKYGDMPR